MVSPCWIPQTYDVNYDMKLRKLVVVRTLHDFQAFAAKYRCLIHIYITPERLICGMKVWDVFTCI